MAHIDELYSGPERKAALVGLLEQEAYLIGSIDRHKLAADEENKDKKIKRFLNKVCATATGSHVVAFVSDCVMPFLLRVCCSNDAKLLYTSNNRV